jgi:hypothetical protein
MAIPSTRTILPRLRVYRANGTDFINLTSHLLRANINLGDVSGVGTGSSGVDSGVRQAKFTLQNDDDNSLHPKVSSTYNTPVLLFPNRRITYEVSRDGGSTYDLLFDGLLGDGIDSSFGKIELQCRDHSKRLQDAFIKPAFSGEPQVFGTAGGQAAQTVIQNIINANVTSPPTVSTPVAPGFNVLEYQLEYQTVWSAIQQVAMQIGWFIAYQRVGGSFVLRFIEPPRSKTTPDETLSWTSDFYKQDLSTHDHDIRNVVEIRFRDVDGLKTSVTATDSASVASFGERYMLIEEGDTSFIKTTTDATRMANAALADLSQLSGATRVEMPYYPLELFDLVQITYPKLSNTNDKYAVESIQHEFVFGEQPRFRTTFVGTERVIGGRDVWLKIEKRPGTDPNDPDGKPGTTSGRPKAPTNVIATPGQGLTVIVTWDEVKDLRVNEYEVWRKVGNTPSDPTGAIKLGDEQGGRFVDTTGVVGTQYTYFVKAVNFSNLDSEFSVGDEATFPSVAVSSGSPTSFLTAGATLVVASTTTMTDTQGVTHALINLTLDAVPVDVNRAYVQIRHRRSGQTTWQLDDQREIASGGPNTITIDDLIPGELYTFQASPVSFYGIYGVGVEVDQVVASDTTIPDDPASVTATPIINGGVIRWTNPTDLDYAFTEVYADTSGAGFTPGAGNYKGKSASSIFTLVNLVGGTLYYVKLRHIDESGNASAYVSTSFTARKVDNGDIDQTPPDSLAAATLTNPANGVYQDAAGNWFAEMGFSVTGIPADDKRAFILVRYRRATTDAWTNEQQLYTASGSTTFDISGLITGVLYNFQLVPISHFGIAGTPEVASFTAPADTAAPATPTGFILNTGIKSLTARWTLPTELDYSLTELELDDNTGFTSPVSHNGYGSSLSVTLPSPAFVVNTTYYARIRHRDYSGNWSAWAGFQSFTPGQIGVTEVTFQTLESATFYTFTSTQVVSTTSSSTVNLLTVNIPVDVPTGKTGTLEIHVSFGSNLLRDNSGGIPRLSGEFYLNVDGNDSLFGTIRNIEVDSTTVINIVGVGAFYRARVPVHTLYRKTGLAVGAYNVPVILRGSVGSADTIEAVNLTLMATVFYGQ